MAGKEEEVKKENGKEERTIYISDENIIRYDSEHAFRNSEELKQVEETVPVSPIVLAQTKMRETYKDLFSRQYDNLVILSGSGTSVGIGDVNKKGKTMKGLWEKVVAEIGFESLKDFAKAIAFKGLKEEDTDLEALISKAQLAESYKPNPKVQSTLEEVKKIIREACELLLPDDAPHSQFLQKITSRKTKYERAKIFTLNYDLLFEQAAAKGGYVVIDGFSFSNPRLFSGVNYDYDIVIRNHGRSLAEENFAPRVFHLYKPHGSLDWQRAEINGKEVFQKMDHPVQPVMIYPSHEKYESSYDQPYFEMISRFQKELRARNTMLIVIGFSFYNKHIKAMIMEALDTNPSISLAVVAPDACEAESFACIRQKAEKMKNVVLIGETFADFVTNFPYSDVYDYSEGIQR